MKRFVAYSISSCDDCLWFDEDGCHHYLFKKSQKITSKKRFINFCPLPEFRPNDEEAET